MLNLDTFKIIPSDGYYTAMLGGKDMNPTGNFYNTEVINRIIGTVLNKNKVALRRGLYILFLNKFLIEEVEGCYIVVHSANGTTPSSLSIYTKTAKLKVRSTGKGLKIVESGVEDYWFRSVEEMEYTFKTDLASIKTIRKEFSNIEKKVNKIMKNYKNG